MINDDVATTTNYNDNDNDANNGTAVIITETAIIIETC